MSKYFAKYIPVEGEKKKGDLVKHKDGTFTNIIGEFDPDRTNPDWQKLQLFLCSRDINPGDKVWDTLNEKYHEVTIPFTALHTSDGDNVPCWYLKTEPKTFHEASFLIKVIGPISSEATWVKEGDEFEEYELWWWSIVYNHPIFKVVSDDKDKMFKDHANDVTKVCKVQCPTCNTFH